MSRKDFYPVREITKEAFVSPDLGKFCKVNNNFFKLDFSKILYLGRALSHCQELFRAQGHTVYEFVGYSGKPGNIKVSVQCSLENCLADISPLTELLNKCKGNGLRDGHLSIFRCSIVPIFSLKQSFLVVIGVPFTQ